MLGEAWKSFTVALGANEIKSAVMAVQTNSTSECFFFQNVQFY